MKGQLFKISIDGSISVETLSEPPNLEQLRTIVGGHIEVVPFFDTIVIGAAPMPCVAFCNEEGKLDQLPVNDMAQALWLRALGRRDPRDYLVGHDPRDYLVGNIALVTGDDELMQAL